MKKSLIALAVLGSMVGAASAQSSVTLFGGVDVNVSYNKGGGQTAKSMGNAGIYSSRWGVRGTEDLGGGLKAGFWLESAINPDDGTSNGDRFWHRRASVSLMGDFGEVRLGRFLTNGFTAFADFDPFGTNGVGDVNKYLGNAMKSGVSSLTRADNIAAYYLPGNLGGLYGSAEISAGEGATGAGANNKYIGGRIGYAAGPVNVSAAFSNADPDTSNTDFKRTTFSASYDLGVAKLMGFYNQAKFGASKQTTMLIGATVPLGSGHVRASFTNVSANAAAEKAAASGDSKQIALGYVHDLSKRTAVYGNVSRVTNDKGASFKVAGPTAWGKGIGSGADNGGIEVGVKHTF